VSAHGSVQESGIAPRLQSGIRPGENRVLELLAAMHLVVTSPDVVVLEGVIRQELSSAG
jgi:hypothetical protein